MSRRESQGMSRGRAIPSARRSIDRIAVAVLLACCACSSSSSPGARGSLTTDTDSQSLPDREQRMAFLARYLRFKSPLADAEYIIWYQDNGGGAVPGPSDWDIRAVLQVEGQAAAWHEAWAPCAAEDATAAEMVWAQPLLDRRPSWKTLRASPRCYRDPRAPASVAIVFEEDGVVLYRNASARAP